MRPEVLQSTRRVRKIGGGKARCHSIHSLQVGEHENRASHFALFAHFAHLRQLACDVSGPMVWSLRSFRSPCALCSLSIEVRTFLRTNGQVILLILTALRNSLILDNRLDMCPDQWLGHFAHFAHLGHLTHCFLTKLHACRQQDLLRTEYELTHIRHQPLPLQDSMVFHDPVPESTTLVVQRINSTSWFCAMQEATTHEHLEQQTHCECGAAE